MGAAFCAVPLLGSTSEHPLANILTRKKARSAVAERALFVSLQGNLRPRSADCSSCRRLDLIRHEVPRYRRNP